MKHTFTLFLLLVLTGSCAFARSSSTHKTAKRKAVKTEEYTGPILRVKDPRTEQPVLAGFMANGHYKFTVVQTVTPSIHYSGAVQPRVHVCIEGNVRNGACSEELANGYGNINWEADANTKCHLVAYKPDGTKIPVKKALLNARKPYTGNEFTWEDDQYKVSVSVSKCKVMPNGVCICK